MSKLEYINPSDWSLHVIDGESECVPEGWIELPKGADFLAKCSDGLFSLWAGNVQFAVKESGEIKASKYIVDRDQWIKKWNPEILWSRKMKEYLVERDGKYELVEAYHLDGGIEVPEGAEVYFRFPDGNRFLTFKENLAFSLNGFGNLLHHLTKMGVMQNKNRILWQRNPSLNNQCAEIEEVCKIDNVNNPEHYNKGGVECIDAIESSMTKEAFAGYLKGNVQKYMWRYENKGGVESLKKAQWYLNKLVNLVEGDK